MKVICHANTGGALSASHATLGYSSKSRFDVVVGKEYVVFAIALWNHVLLLLVLVSDESGLPENQTKEPLRELRIAASSSR